MVAKRELTINVIISFFFNLIVNNLSYQNQHNIKQQKLIITKSHNKRICSAMTLRNILSFIMGE